MRNELQRHKRSDKVKWVLTGIMFFLAFVMIAGLFLQVFGTGKTKPSEWFKKQDTEQTEQLPAEGGESGTARTRVKAMAATLSTESENSGTVLLSETMATALSLDGYIGTLAGSSLFVNAFSTSDGFVSASWKAFGFKFVNKDNGNILYPCDGGEFSYISAFEGKWYSVESTHGSPASIIAAVRMRINFSYDSGLDLNHLAKIGDLSLDYENFAISSFSGASNSALTDSQTKVVLEQSTLGNRLYVYFVYRVEDLGRFPYGTYGGNITLSCEKKSLPLPADPVKEGYVFTGWHYGTNDNCDGNCTAYAGEKITEDTQLHAHWHINQFTVVFNSDGGSSVASQTVNWNTAATLTTPTKAKHAFKGWFLPDGTEYTNQPVKEDITLKAHWERNVFTVTFNTDGGSAVESQDVNLNAAATLPTTTKTGNVFIGWYLADGTQYTNQPVTDDISLTARWEVQTFTVTFYVDGEVYATKTVEYGQGLEKVAETANLKILSVRMESGVPTFDDNGAVIVTENCSVEAQEMSDTDKAINTIKQNKWAIIGGVAGGVALIAVIAAVCGGKRKRKR